MNHFAHLVLAKPTTASVVGNLLGDFARGVDLEGLPSDIHAGLMNHRAVDRFTDSHLIVQQMRAVFSPQRRRFAGIALDIYFDHLLLTHWAEFETRDDKDLIDGFYRRIRLGQSLMPSAQMRKVSQHIVDYDWFGSYRDLDQVAEVLDRVAARIRFANQFDHSIDDLLVHQAMIEDGFFEFYPQLQAHVVQLALEPELALE